MPLLDHFHKPLLSRAPWPGIGQMWVSAVVRSLNQSALAPRYFALPSGHFGSRFEADIAEYELTENHASSPRENGVSLQFDVAPAVVTMEATFPDELAVQIKDTEAGMDLAAVIEFISPSNLDRDEERKRFVSKCMGYLEHEVGLVVVDVVTNRHANLHNELIAALRGPKQAMLNDVSTYVAGYRPSRGESKTYLDVWPYATSVGLPIPSVPLSLKDGPLFPLDLEGTYLAALTDIGLIESR